MSEQEQRHQDTQGRNGGPTIRRIVVALDATAQSAILLEAAALLAQRLGVELTGIFVEDSNLLRLGELSFVQETGSYSPARRPLQAAQLERQLRSQAVALQRAVRNTAERYQIPWTFQVLRGPIADELRKAAAETDLFVVGRSRQSRQGRVPLGTTTRAVVITAPRFTLVLHQQPVWQQPVVVVYDGSAAAQRALTLATQLTQAEDVPLMVVLVGEEAAMAQELRQTVATWLHQRGLRAHYQWLSRGNIARLVNVVVAAKGGALVLPGKDLAAQETALLALLDELQCPVLLVQ